MTLTAAVDRVEREAAETAEAFSMDEGAFRAFYDRTARAVWAYLSRVTGNNAVADDLVQETYYRFLCARVSFENETHRRNYLFRIATNVARDRHRRNVVEARVLQAEARTPQAGNERTGDDDRRAEVRKAMGRLRPRDRQILWLAYAESFSHDEIARALGLRVNSVKVVLHRARERFRRVLQSIAGGDRHERG